MIRKVIVISDIHACAPGETMFGVDTLRRFSEAVAQATRDHGDAAHIILTGDIANSGAIAEYEGVRAVLAGVAIPVTLMPGNHDNRDTLLQVFPETPVTPSGHVQSVIEIGEDRLITLDTLDGPPFRDHHAAGVLCAARLDWLRRALAGTEGRRVLVFTHHPPYAVGIPRLDCINLRNGAELLAILEAAGNVAHIFSGHVHRTISGTAQGIGFSLIKSIAHQLPMVPPEESGRPLAPEAGVYAVVYLSDENVIVHTEDLRPVDL